MTKKCIAACVQLNSQPDIDVSLKAAKALVEQTVDQGAGLVLLPECSPYLGADAEGLRAGAYDEAEHPALLAIQEWAREHKIWLHAGSIAVKAHDTEDRAYNRSYVLNPRGEVVSAYDKIHLFDVDVGKTDSSGGRYQESAYTKAGEGLVVADTPWGGLGLSICYDLRFPEHYRAMTNAGAVMFSVPSAFTVPTGQAHWEVLCRARAIESAAYVFAPAQVGQHGEKRTTYGHSMIIDPWGKVIAEADGVSTGIIMAEIDMSLVEECRAKIPAWQG